MQALVQNQFSQNVSQSLQIGYARFKQGFQRNQSYKLISTSLKNVLSKQNWRIRHLSQEWISTFKQMFQNNCKRIFFQSLSYEKILSDISQCRFPNLTVLNLSHNPIHSLQPLIYIDAYQLQFIYLSTNNISSVKCLGKLHFKNLQQFDLSWNKLKEITHISRYKTNRDNINFSIELFSFSKSHHHHHHYVKQNHQFDQHEHQPICRIQDIRQMAKLQLHNPTFYKISSINTLKYNPTVLNNDTTMLNNNTTALNYQMQKRQFQKFIIELTTGIKLTEYVPQKNVMRALQNKFGW